MVCSLFFNFLTHCFVGRACLDIDVEIYKHISYKFETQWMTTTVRSQDECAIIDGN